MKKKVVDISYGPAQYEVIYDDSTEINPFRVYFRWTELTDCGLKKRRKQVERYAELADCLFYIWDEVNRNYRKPLSEREAIRETHKRR